MPNITASSSGPSTFVPVSPLERPDNFNFARDVVDYWAQDPSRIALYWTNQTLTESKQLTYSYFSQQSHRAAALLASLGLKKGDTLIITLPRLPEWWVIATACFRSGVILCPCTTLLVDKDIEYRLQVSQAAAFVGDEVSVGKCLRVMGSCPKLRKVIQVGSAPAAGKRSGKVELVDFAKAMESVPSSTTFAVPPSLTSTSPALIFFTSGTTGPPKMVLHTQISYPLAHALTGIHWLQLGPGKFYWNMAEQGWAKAAWSFFASWNTGAALFIHDDRLAFDWRTTLKVLHKFPVTTMCAPPTVYRQLVLDEARRYFASEAGRPKALEHCCGAGEPLNESVITTWREMTGGITIFDAYGQTETIVMCANQKGNPVKPGSMGKPIPGVPLTVIDSEGNETVDGVEGDMAVEVGSKKGNSGVAGDKKAFFGMFQGYIDKVTGKVDSRIKSYANGKHYYITGDRATKDGEGYFWFVGRSDDVINSSGYRIGPFEVESTLKLHPFITESAVVASPDPDRDEVVKAFIVLTRSAAAKLKAGTISKAALIKEMQDFCKQHAAPYKYPRKIEFVEAGFLPKTISGKIKRADLKALEKRRYQEGKVKAKL